MPVVINEGYVFKFDNGMYARFEQIGDYQLEAYGEKNIFNADMYNEDEIENSLTFIKKSYEDCPIEIYDNKKLIEVKIVEKIKIRKTIVIEDCLDSTPIE